MNWFIKSIDWSSKWMTPAFLGIAALSGALWEHDFAGQIHTQFPERTGLYQILQSYIPALFIVTFLLGGLFSFLRLFTQKTLSGVEKELTNEREKVKLIANNVETLVNGLLLKLSERIGFERGEPSRITIYVHNGNGNFIPFGRYTPDPSYTGVGRSLLPDNEGCISAAWSGDWCYEGNLLYKKARQTYKIDKDTYSAQRMQSKCFAVKRIDSNNRQPLAVLVVESKTADRFDKSTIQQILDNEESYLAEIISCLRDHIPDPQEATKRGF